MRFLSSRKTLLSPIIAQAVDIVVQKAMYELSDKICKIGSRSNGNTNGTSNDSSNDSTGNFVLDNPEQGINWCISLIVHVCIPFCQNVAELFGLSELQRSISPMVSPPLTPHNNTGGYNSSRAGGADTTSTSGSSNVGGIGICERTYTLNRQLQELLQWTKMDGQTQVPLVFPRRDSAQSGGGSSNSSSSKNSNSEDTDCVRSGGNALKQQQQQHVPYVQPPPQQSLYHLDEVLVATVAEMTQIPPQLFAPSAAIESIRSNLQRILSLPFGMNVSVNLCGSLVAGLPDPEPKLSADFLAENGSPIAFNVYNLPLPDQKADALWRFNVREEFKMLENSIECDSTSELAMKHLRACVKDFQTFSTQLYNNLCGVMNNIHNQNQQQQQQFQGPSSSSYYGQQQQQQQSGSMVSPRLLAKVDSIMGIIPEDIECMHVIGEAVVEKYINIKLQRIRQHPNILLVMKRMECLQDALDNEESFRMNETRRDVKMAEKSLKDNNNNYASVRSFVHKTRYHHVQFMPRQEPGRPAITCSLYLHNPVPVQATSFLLAYLSLDKSGLVREFVQTVKVFAKSHGIADPSKGFLSSFAWEVMALHVLLHYGFLPNIHSPFIYRIDEDPTSGATTAAAVAAAAAATTTPTTTAAAEGEAREQQEVQGFSSAAAAAASPVRAIGSEDGSGVGDKQQFSPRVSGSNSISASGSGSGNTSPRLLLPNGGHHHHPHLGQSYGCATSVAIKNTLSSPLVVAGHMPIPSTQLMSHVDFMTHPAVQQGLPEEYASKIKETTLIELMDIFFRYYVNIHNTFRDVISLKGQGEVINKCGWRKNQILWRLSIEDPFEHMNSARPYDLGSTLSRPGQLTIFKAMRRAVFGIKTIVTAGPGKTSGT